VIFLLAVLAVAGLAVGVAAYRAGRPKAYQPGAGEEGITSVLTLGLPSDAPAPSLADVTLEAGLGEFRTFLGARTSQLPEDMGSGPAWGDFDNDGDDDLFVVAAGGPLSAPPSVWAPSRLYENLGDGTFRLVTHFPDTRIVGMGAAWGDYDADGWLDLVVTGYNALRLFRNHQGRLVLDDRLGERPGFWAGAAWADFDRDRDLDLYICGYVRYEENDADRARVSAQYGAAVPYTLNPASYEPERNLLFRNRGDGTFEEVAEALGVANPQGRSLSAIWHDFDEDGWLDLYVANDISDNVLYRNQEGTFEDISHEALVADYRGAMGLAVGDWNRDGDDDLFITHWLAQENALYDSLLADLRRPGATATPPGPSASAGIRFMDVADGYGLGQIALQVVGWGAEFADLDGDGWLDLLVANGSTLETSGTPKSLRPQKSFLFWNRRGEHFHDLAPLVPALSTPRVTRGLAVSDYDRDGDLDALLVHLDAGVQLLRNDMQAGNWLRLRLRNRTSGSSRPIGWGDGARIAVRAGDAVIRRAVSSASYLSQSSRVVHVGLGAATHAAVHVHWPDGEASVYPRVAANVEWELVQGESEPRSVARARSAAVPAGPTDRERVVAFWEKQRAAMHAMRVEGNPKKAVGLFREALAINPRHEDSRYYLGNSLALVGDVPGALAEFEELTRINPSSHRAYARWGTLRALVAGSRADLDAAERSLQRAHALNPEETGVLFVMGQLALLRGDLTTAEQRLAAVCRSNPRATGAFFLRAYIAERQADRARAAALLEHARKTLGEDWKPKGTTAEGDVQRRLHDDSTPLSAFWEGWDGVAGPPRAFAPLAAYLRRTAL
jgi:tetratricopeptide (TPR) repeat protein